VLERPDRDRLGLERGGSVELRLGAVVVVLEPFVCVARVQIGVQESLLASGSLQVTVGISARPTLVSGVTHVRYN
jgi:hypothetical protein